MFVLLYESKNLLHGVMFYRICYPYHDNVRKKYVLCAFAKKVNIKVQGVPQSQTAVIPRHQEEEKNEK